jgi:SAM-dependent methyltransferase
MPSAEGSAQTAAAAASEWMRSNGAAFADLEVVEGYLKRPPYAPALYRRLLALPRGRERALDLGCGPGVVAAALAPHFGTVEAVDPSEPMIRLGRQVNTAPNILWRHATAEAFDPSGYDLVVVGMAIHWMRHDAVFPRLADALSPGGAMAVIEANNAAEPPWREAWRQFLTRWLADVGTTYDERAFAAEMRSYRRWMDLHGEADFEFDFAQPLDDFIACQRSRSAWSRSRLGGKADTLEAELHALFTPHAADGWLRCRMRSSMAWGRPRRAQLAAA